MPEAAGEREARGPVPARPAAVAVVYLLALAWLLARAALIRQALPTDVPPDEQAHVSYVAWATDGPRFVPRYEEMRLLDAAGRFGPLPNDLAHPAPYDLALGAADRLLHGQGRPGLDTLTRRLRRAAAALVALLVLFDASVTARALAAF